jgi:hypothetical protein
VIHTFDRIEGSLLGSGGELKIKNRDGDRGIFSLMKREELKCEIRRILEDTMRHEP